ncbi:MULTISPECIES: SAM-dependent methyltransferase [Acinetobacter calcoaceticus/baumannii complex]|uniref:SAM-dependent methyltransferase n=8 Tax=Acinetobacter baumannii TaxID=470 RepID=A0A077GIW8_ACIBA|nr:MULTISPECIES: cyclopropane-fatty-acyl-phospholipid synthase family protein [Acinetobacter calcoaceticus/baumannii complex]AIL76199.1 cyclopropane-fatty-acyl-phospholipid synthase [Acinetobacter baumannii]AVI32080.1 mycolic acid cyclopropane synthetase family protein [Acinetobacter baumannii]AVI39246.1 mycolic acid cyclopropane synthetase family protein [Acinetobacter baumannii]EHU1238013.1 class I SAM-dependent methyltransferase [Acinetobacter baumannii]EHU1450288.1 class I SAM-dependent me
MIKTFLYGEDDSLPLLLKSLLKLRHGQITFQGAWNGTVGEVSDLHAVIEVHNPLLMDLILKNGVLGAAEGYIRGDWSSEHLVELIQILARNRAVLDQINQNVIAQASQFFLKAWYQNRKNSISGSRKNIAEHYDLSNDFFKLFLDPSLMYSSAVFENENMTLEEASDLKKEIICKKLDLKPLDHLVEIGSGWGGFAIYAAQHYGCRVTTITISQAQYDEAVTRVNEAGLAHRIDVQLKDYRLLEGKFDKLVSIEMVEAVGAQYLSTYFDQCKALLKPKGLAFIQAIIIEDFRYKKALNTVDYIKRYIFPGSFIPSVSVLTQTASESGLRLKHLNDIGLSYAHTLHHWRARFLAAREQVLALGFDENFIRMWDFYLCYCEGGFKEGVISNVHLLFESTSY